jgi:hypothetical protein
VKKSRLFVIALALTAGLAFAPAAFSSVLIARSATDVHIRVVRDHQALKALVFYKRGGQENIVLAWGALNARAHPKCGKLHGPICGPRQVQMKHLRLHRSGHLAKRILALPDLCKNYDGPVLKYWVTGCKAPDNSYWGAQSWARLGAVCTLAGKGPEELRLSHWSGPVAKLHLFLDWYTPHPHVTNPIRYDHIFGWYSYKGKPVYGLNWSGIGVPTDGYGRVIYIQSRNTMCHGKSPSPSGIGGTGGVWDHDEDGMSLPINGQTCHTYGPMGTKHYLSTGDMYRATAMGPGVTPDVSWGPMLMPTVFDPVYEMQMQALQRKLAKGSKFCKNIH